MNLNLTLFGEMITFSIFIWFTMRFVWPPLMKAMEERREKIAAGLAAAEKSQRDLESTQHKITELLADAKTQAAQFIEQANQRAHVIIEESKAKARAEGDRLLEIAKNDIAREYQSAREVLLGQISTLAIAGAEKILGHEIDKSANDELVNQLVKEIEL